MRSYDVKNYTKVSNAIDERLLSGEKFETKLQMPDKMHWSMKSSMARFDPTITHNKVDIGEADIELELKMNTSKKIVEELFTHID